MTSCCSNNKNLEEEAEELEKEVDRFLKLESLKCKRDSLELIFDKQTQLKDYVAKSKPNSYYHHGEERYPYERVKLNCDAIIHEVIELVNGTTWKWWKDYEVTDLDLIAETQMPVEDDSDIKSNIVQILEEDQIDKPFLTDEQRATQKQILENSKLQYIQKELIDIAHFLFQACIETGMTAQQFLDMYLDKNKVNHERQDNHY